MSPEGDREEMLRNRMGHETPSADVLLKLAQVKQRLEPYSALSFTGIALRLFVRPSRVENLRTLR